MCQPAIQLERLGEHGPQENYVKHKSIMKKKYRHGM